MYAGKVVPVDLCTVTTDTCVMASFVLHREHTVRLDVFKANSGELVLLSLGLQVWDTLRIKLSALLHCLEPGAVALT